LFSSSPLAALIRLLLPLSTLPSPENSNKKPTHTPNNRELLLLLLLLFPLLPNSPLSQNQPTIQPNNNRREKNQKQKKTSKSLKWVVSKAFSPKLLKKNGKNQVLSLTHTEKQTTEALVLLNPRNKKNYHATIASNTQNLQKTGKRGKEREDRTHPQQQALLLRKKAPLAIIIIITLSRSHHKPNYCRYTHAMSETRTTHPLICSQALSAETNRNLCCCCSSSPPPPHHHHHPIKAAAINKALSHTTTTTTTTDHTPSPSLLQKFQQEGNTRDHLNPFSSLS
jgi:hypothetical protein